MVGGLDLLRYGKREEHVEVATGKVGKMSGSVGRLIQRETKPGG